MANTIDIRRRIRSVKNTQQITKAMKMVAAAKLRRAQERMFAARPYAAALRQVLTSVATRVESLNHPLLSVRDEKRVLLICVTADKGLAGAFNSNITKATVNAIKEHNWESADVLPIGRKANDFFKRRTIPIRKEATAVFQMLTLGTAQSILKSIVDDFIAEKLDAVYVVYNEFKSIIAQRVVVERLLPIERAWDNVGNEVD